LPEILPAHGFGGEIAVEASHAGCVSRACLVHEVYGDIRPDCVPCSYWSDPLCETERCASEDEVEERVYCSCHCDAPDGPAECTCPTGYSCQPVLPLGPKGVTGSYCVRDEPDQ
jgi:hypothetical protein